MKRAPFREVICAELIAALDALTDRYSRFGIGRAEVVELALYQGLTKTRASIERMEAERACSSAPRVPA